MPRKKTSESGEESNSFEEAMERVEAIVAAMESDGLQLEEMLVQYEEGARLLAYCQDRIDSAQKRIELISAERKGDAVTLKPFDGDQAEATAAGISATAPARQSETRPDDIRLL